MLVENPHGADNGRMHRTPRTENFPVASWLSPPHLRAPILAIYRFARTADDMADEGDASADQRLRTLATYRAALHGGPGWPEVFGPLHRAIAAHDLPMTELDALLTAFEQDCRGGGFADRAELLAYCRHSANPVGRLLLRLYAIDDAQALAEADALCTALQLINFWQDLSEDLPRGRHNVPRSETDLVALLDWAASELARARALPHRVPGRAGWELRLVWQGGARVLEKSRRLGSRLWQERPRLTAGDAPLLLMRAAMMKCPP